MKTTYATLEALAELLAVSPATLSRDRKRAGCPLDAPPWTEDDATAYAAWRRQKYGLRVAPDAPVRITTTIFWPVDEIDVSRYPGTLTMEGRNVVALHRTVESCLAVLRHHSGKDGLPVPPDGLDRLEKLQFLTAVPMRRPDVWREMLSKTPEALLAAAVKDGE